MFQKKIIRFDFDLKFVCYAENEINDDTQDFQVLRRGKPDPPVAYSLKARSELIPTIPVTVKINITWVPGYSGGAEVGLVLICTHIRRKYFCAHEVVYILAL